MPGDRARARTKAGRSRRRLRGSSGPLFVVTGDDEKSFAAAEAGHETADRLLRLDPRVPRRARPARLGRPPARAQPAVEAGQVGGDGQPDQRRDAAHVRGGRRRPRTSPPSCAKRWVRCGWICLFRSYVPVQVRRSRCVPMLLAELRLRSAQMILSSGCRSAWARARRRALGESRNACALRRRDRRPRSDGRRRRRRAARARAGPGRATAPRARRRAPDRRPRRRARSACRGRHGTTTCSRSRRSPERLTFSAMAAARCATFCAAGCGVVTTITSARGRNCAIESAMSPVPGGMSTTRKSGSPQCTSVRNCSSALCSIGPRHTTAWSSRAKKPIEMRRTPLASGGTITSSMRSGGAVDAEHARHREAPHVGVDRRDLVARVARARSTRLVVTDDLPTPPLPDAIASTRVRASVNGFDAAAAALARPATRRRPAAGSAGAHALEQPAPARRARRRSCRGGRRRRGRRRRPRRPRR